VAVLVNAAILYGVNVWPGWRVVPILTGDFPLVLGLVNASIVVGLVANVVYVLADPRWLKALGDLLSTSVGLAALLRIWQVFPFDFSGSSFDWALVTRVLLGVAIGGSVIAIVVALVSFVKSLWRAPS
jgi:predicted membrane protein